MQCRAFKVDRLLGFAVFAVGFAEDKGEQNREQHAKLEKHRRANFLMAAARVDVHETMHGEAQPDRGRAAQQDDEDEIGVGHAAPYHVARHVS
jgi:hypothetical protein